MDSEQGRMEKYADFLAKEAVYKYYLNNQKSGQGRLADAIRASIEAGFAAREYQMACEGNTKDRGMQ